MEGGRHTLQVGSWRVDVAATFLSTAREHGFLRPWELVRDPRGLCLEEGAGRRVSLHDLRYPAPSRRIVLFVYAPSGLRSSRGRWHARSTERERGLGLPFAPVVWWAERRRFAGRFPSAVAVELDEKAQSLEELLVEQRDPAGLLRDAARALGATPWPAGRLPRLRAWLLYRSTSEGREEASGGRTAWIFTDPGPAGRRASSATVRELVRFDASLPPGALTVRERLHAYRAYRRATGRVGYGRGETRSGLREIVGSDLDFRDRLRIQRTRRFGLVRDTQGGALFVCDAALEDVLAKAGLRGAAAALTGKVGERLRALPDRENYRIAVSGYRTGRLVLYMKRFAAGRVADRVADVLRGRLERTSRARWEWENLLQIRSIGIATADPVAMAERRPGRRGASAVLTREIEGAVPLDAWVGERYPPAFPAHPGKNRDPGMPRKRDVIRGVARLARTLHRAGAYHKDLYLNHILVREGAGGVVFHLIDLDRLRWGRRVRSRWFVKDVAALHISADPRIFSRADRLRFLEAYCRCGRDDPGLRTFARRVLRKGARMRAHVPRHLPGEREAR